MKDLALFPRTLALAVVVLLWSGCSSAYYGAMEKFDIAKREILAQ